MVSGVVLNKDCSIKAFKDSDTSKHITLRVKFDDIALSAVFAKAVSSAVIQWQNGPGRSKYDNWINKQTVDISFKAPGAMPLVDPEIALANKIKAMDRDAKKAQIAKVRAQMDEIERLEALKEKLDEPTEITEVEEIDE